MKKIMVFIALMFLLSLPVCAEEDTYSKQYEASGAGELYYSLPDNAKDYMVQNEIDPASSDWVGKLNTQNVFSHILNLFKGGIKAPIKTAGIALGLIMLTAAFPAFSPSDTKHGEIISVLCIALVIAVPVWQTVSAAVEAVKGSSSFMLCFVPIFAGIVTISGGAVTAVSMSALLLGAAEAVSAVAAFIILPLMGSYLAVSICSSVSPLSGEAQLAEGIRRVAFWVLSFITTVFVAILGIQTAVNSSADTLALKTGKFIIGTAVPIGGAALTEAASTVTASLSLLRSSVGIYAIVALAAILLPIVIEMLIWRIMMFFCVSVSAQFSLGGVTKLLKAVDMMLSVLVGMVLLVAAMFIISLTVVVGAVKAV